MEANPETSGASLEVRLGQNHEQRERQTHAEGGETLCNSAALVVQLFFSHFGTGFGETMVALRCFEWTCVGTILMKS